MKINSYYPVLSVSDIQKSSEFFQNFFNFKPVFENEWYTHLQQTSDPSINLAFVAEGHNSIPASHQRLAQGILLNFELDEIDGLYETFRKENLEILLSLRDEAWGQRHFIVAAPCGLMVDVIKLIEPSEEFKAQYM